MRCASRWLPRSYDFSFSNTFTALHRAILDFSFVFFFFFSKWVGMEFGRSLVRCLGFKGLEEILLNDLFRLFLCTFCFLDLLARVSEPYKKFIAAISGASYCKMYLCRFFFFLHFGFCFLLRAVSKSKLLVLCSCHLDFQVGFSLMLEGLACTKLAGEGGG